MINIRPVSDLRNKYTVRKTIMEITHIIYSARNFDDLI